MQKAKNLGLALIALGFIEIAWVLFCIFGGLLLGLMGFVDDQMMAPMLFLSGAYGVLAAVNAPIAALHIFTGTRLRQGTGLFLTIASLAACMIQMVMALYCSPFELAVLIYGVIVLADGDVRTLLEGDAS